LGVGVPTPEKKRLSVRGLEGWSWWGAADAAGGGGGGALLREEEWEEEEDVRRIPFTPL
jgi:hypothetical protein